MKIGKMQSMVAALAAETTARIAREHEEQAQKLQLARLWDYGAPDNVKAPEFIHPWKLYGTIGTYHFKDCTPEDVLALLDAFPPVPGMDIKTNGSRSFRPAQTVTAEELAKAEASRDIEGITFQLDGGAEYGQKCTVHWWAQMGAGSVLVDFSCELRNISGVTPRIAYRTKQAAGHIVEVYDCSVTLEPFPYTEHLQQCRYGKGSPLALNTFVVYSPYSGQGMVRKHIQAWADKLFAEGRESQRAYEAAKANPVAVTPAEVPLRETYDRENLRAGTFEQWACLHTAEALTDCELARSHWKCYRADRGIPAERDYFDHFAWACAYLKRHGLYEVEHDGKPYKYGSAWV